jgi:drug/metabolite transporter (DMT)-like permease
MATVAHDTSLSSGAGAPRSRVASGIAFAVASSTTFALSGPLARGLLDTGWTASAVVLIRIALAALLVLPFGLIALRGRWPLLRRNAGVLVVYGGLAVAGAQFCYFSAVAHMQVGPALLIEYTAPAAVVVWMWLRHGHRPGPMTLVGAGLAALGLVLVLDLISGTDLNIVGVLWALGAMVGAASYFVISAHEDNGLPPLALAAGGLVIGGVLLGVLGAVGVLPMRAATTDPSYMGHEIAWWVPLVLLGVVTAAIAYVTGIAAARRLGSRLASFVSLLEVVAAVVFAWLLLNELPRAVQLLGGVLILAGVVAVKLGERQIPVTPKLPEPPAEPLPEPRRSRDA